MQRDRETESARERERETHTHTPDGMLKDGRGRHGSKSGMLVFCIFGKLIVCMCAKLPWAMWAMSYPFSMYLSLLHSEHTLNSKP